MIRKKLFFPGAVLCWTALVGFGLSPSVRAADMPRDIAVKISQQRTKIDAMTMDAKEKKIYMAGLISAAKAAATSKFDAAGTELQKLIAKAKASEACEPSTTCKNPTGLLEALQTAQEAIPGQPAQPEVPTGTGSEQPPEPEKPTDSGQGKPTDPVETASGTDKPAPPSETKDWRGPVFPDPAYAMTPVRAKTNVEWAEAVLGAPGWTMEDEPSSGRAGLGQLDPASGGVRSVDEGGLMTVMAQGPTAPVNTVSYVAVTGPGAATVDVAVYPPSKTGGASYKGWDGAGFVDGVAKPVNGYFWYRLKVAWSPPYQDPNAVLYAKTYRKAGATGERFTLWAYLGESETVSEAVGFGTLAIRATAQDGEALAGVLCTLSTPPGRSGITGANGTARLGGVPGGSGTLSCELDGFQSLETPVEIQANRTSSVVLEMSLIILEE